MKNVQMGGMTFGFSAPIQTLTSAFRKGLYAYQGMTDLPVLLISESQVKIAGVYFGWGDWRFSPFIDNGRANYGLVGVKKL